jgi:hypothetical protein
MICEYSGYSSFTHQDANMLHQIKQVAEEAGIEIDISPTTLEIDYVGRDHFRKIIRFLIHVAALLHQAEGEMEYLGRGDETVPMLEYLTIKNDCVYRQPCRIVRLPEERVALSEESRDRSQ